MRPSQHCPVWAGNMRNGPTTSRRPGFKDIVRASGGYAEAWRWVQTLARWIGDNRDSMIRAEVMDDKRVVLRPFNDISVDMPPAGDYTIGTEPMWVTDRLMALGLMELPPPPRLIEGVGTRISATVFWIIVPTKEP